MTEITLLNGQKVTINENLVAYCNHEVIEQTDKYFVKVGVDLFAITKLSYDKLVGVQNIKAPIVKKVINK